MTAEEYIKDNTFQTEEDSWDVVEVEYVYEAIEMARQEEREKAIEIVKTAYKNALYECKTNKGTYKSPIYIFEYLMKNCDKLLNQ